MLGKADISHLGVSKITAVSQISPASIPLHRPPAKALAQCHSTIEEDFFFFLKHTHNLTSRVEQMNKKNEGTSFFCFFHLLQRWF